MRESFAFSADGDSGAMSRARETERSLLRGRRSCKLYFHVR
jgi:hypothetical protein